MVDPIGTASGTSALAIFAFNATVSLYEALNSFKKSPKNLTDLKEELCALKTVLCLLRDAVSQTHDEFTQLEPVLSRCGQGCDQFLALINKCTLHSSESKPSIRDWAKLKYKQTDVVDFKDTLNRDKSTISLAIGGINLHRVTVTAELLDKYQQIIARTMSETKQHLQDIDCKLQALSGKEPCISDDDAAELKRLKSEKTEIERDLVVFAKLLESLHEVRCDRLENALKDQLTNQAVRNVISVPLENRITPEDVQEFEVKLRHTMNQRKLSLKSIDSKLQPAAPSHEKPLIEEVEMLQKDREIDEQCLSFYMQLSKQAEAKRVNLINDISAAKNARQIIVSTFGDLISSRNVRAEDGAIQITGQMSDVSLQQTFRDASSNLSMKTKTEQGHWTVPGQLLVFCILAVLSKNIMDFIWTGI